MSELSSLAPPEAAPPAARSGRLARNVALNTVVLTLGQLLGRVTGLVFVPFISRQLGSADLAAWQLSNVLVAYFSILVLFGLSPLLVRSMAQDPAAIPRLFARSLALRLVFAVLALAALAALLFVADYPPIVSRLTLSLSVTLFVVAVTDAADTVFQAHERMGYSTFVTLTSTAIYLGLGWIALQNGYGVLGLAVANALAAVLRAGLALTIIRIRFFAPRLHWDWAGQQGLLREAVPFFLGGASAYLLSKADVFILSRMVPLQVVGLYTAGYFFLDLALFLPASFAQAVYPALSRAAAEGPGALAGLTGRFHKVLFAAGLLVIVTAVPLAGWLTGFLYGPRFGASVPVLQIVIWSVVLVGYNNVLGRAIYAAGGQWPLVWLAAVSALSNVVLNLALIPLIGIMGSSIATVASFGLAALLHTRLARIYGCSVRLTPLLRALPGLALGLLVGVLLARGPAPLALAAVPLVYGLGLALCGYFDPQELHGLGRLGAVWGAMRRWA